MFKLKAIFVSFFLLSTFTLQAQLDNSIFWEIRADSSSKPSYIFGTHHLYNFDFIKKNNDILDKIKKADIMFGEVVIDENDPSLIIKATLATMMPNNSLDNLMSEEDYQATSKYFKETVGFDIKRFNKLKPIAIQQTLLVAKYANMQKEKVSSHNNSLKDMNALSSSMDAFFQNKAKEYKKEVLGLETVDYQLKTLYDSYTLERQTEILLEMVYGGNESMEELYEAQNLEALYQLTKKNTTSDELKMLLTNRNENWIPVIDKYLKKQQSLFIAVGAGHLPGELGVLKLLQNKGYNIRPIIIEIN